MSVVTLQTGTGDGYAAVVSSDGRVQTDVESVQRVVEPVTTRPEIMSVATTTVSVATTSAQRIAERTGRRWIEIQNVGDYPVHLVFGTTSTPATAAHRRLDPGAVFSVANGVSCEDAVQMIAIGGASAIAAFEFFTS